jgi:ABC-type transport system substrate-binding protein
MKSYWQQMTLSRRRALRFAAGAGGTAVALSLVGCGSDASKGDSSGGTNGTSAVTTPKDTTSQAKQGGTLSGWAANESPNFDVIAGGGTGTTLNQVSPFAYQRLIQFSLAKYPNAPTGEVTGDFAESWELSPDKLTLTMKLRQNNKWDSRAPTSGRVADSSDVMYTWNKLKAIGNYKNDIYYDAKVAPDAPVESINAPDAGTIVIKLKKPSTSLLPTLAGWRNSFFISRKKPRAVSTRVARFAARDPGASVKTSPRSASPGYATLTISSRACRISTSTKCTRSLSTRVSWPSSGPAIFGPAQPCHPKSFRP